MLPVAPWPCWVVAVPGAPWVGLGWVDMDGEGGLVQVGSNVQAGARGAGGGGGQAITLASATGDFAHASVFYGAVIAPAPPTGTGGGAAGGGPLGAAGGGAAGGGAMAARCGGTRPAPPAAPAGRGNQAAERAGRWNLPPAGGVHVEPVSPANPARRGRAPAHWYSSRP